MRGVQGNERMWVLERDPFPDELFVPTAGDTYTYDGRSSLHIHDGKINGEVYCLCLGDAFILFLYEKDYLGLKRSKECVFMQDGASFHTSKSTYEWHEKELHKLRS